MHPIPPSTRAVSNYGEQIGNFNGNWINVSMLPFIAIRDTKVQYFQLKFINRNIDTNSSLHKIKLSHTYIL